MAAVMMFLSSCAKKTNANPAISKLFKTTLIPAFGNGCLYSSDAAKSIDERSDWVTTTDDGRTIVCWHPETEFPYECTKPLPILETKLNEADSELKIEHRLEYLNKTKYFDTKHAGLNAHRLGAFTYTNKHRWFPRLEKRYRKPDPPFDREGM